jgi:branched-chain amino acid transport system ATP-binding protein
MLKLESVSLAYGAIQAVKQVSLHVDAGEVVSIIGANGAGKSTLLKGIAGLEMPIDGNIRVNDHDITRLPAHRRLEYGLALSPEGRGVFPDQSVLDNLVLGCVSRRYTAKQQAALLDEQYALFPRLSERSQQMAGTLSGGEQQMLAIARALMGQPKLLLLDEPSLGLAPIIIQDIFRSIRSLRERGITIVLVEQMANQALSIADRAYVLENGRITLEGTGAELKNNPKIREAYLGVH